METEKRLQKRKGRDRLSVDCKTVQTGLMYMYWRPQHGSEMGH
jgi:hypothetical protein